MFDIILFITLVIFAPYIIAGFLLGTVFVKLAELFRIPVLFTSLSVAGLGILAWLNSTPNPDVPYSTVAEVFGQSHLFGVPAPVICLGVSAMLFAASFKGLKRREAA